MTGWPASLTARGLLRLGSSVHSQYLLTHNDGAIGKRH